MKSAIPPEPAVMSVSLDSRHRFSKPVASSITLIEGFGVEGDAHAGVTTQHRYLKRKNPHQLNLTQVHLIASELFDELADQGFSVTAGQLGENITTAGIDLISLPLATRLHFEAAESGSPDGAIVELTGLRSPCTLINKLQDGLMKACISRDTSGKIVRKAGVMGVVLRGGAVALGARIRVELPSGEAVALGPV